MSNSSVRNLLNKKYLVKGGNSNNQEIKKLQEEVSQLTQKVHDMANAILYLENRMKYYARHQEPTHAQGLFINPDEHEVVESSVYIAASFDGEATLYYHKFEGQMREYRLKKLYEFMLNVEDYNGKSCAWISRNTSLEVFMKLFSGKKERFRILWCGKNEDILYYFLKRLKERNLVDFESPYYEQKATYRSIMMKHFNCKNSRSRKPTNYDCRLIEKAADILDTKTDMMKL